MKVTVCQIHDGFDGVPRDWERLRAHVSLARSDLVLLPEMPFYDWFPVSRHFNATTWRAAVAAHDVWEKRLGELGCRVILGTRPMDFGSVRCSVGFAWYAEDDAIATIHVKSQLDNEDGAAEATWYESAIPEFESATVPGDVSVGMMIGPELWLSQRARAYGADGAQIIAVPRVTRHTGREAYEPVLVGGSRMINGWLSGGRTAALAAGAYCISSSRADRASPQSDAGWILAPDGTVLGVTSDEEPCVSAEIEPSLVRTARHA